MKFVACITRTLVVICLTATLTSAWAQSIGLPNQTDAEAAIALDDPTSKAAVRDMVSSLNDDDVRALLMQRLDAVAEKNEQQARDGGGALATLSNGFATFWENASDSITNAGSIPSIFAKIDSTLTQSLLPSGYGRWLLVVLLAVAIGVCAERLVAFYFRKLKQRLMDSFSTTLWGILKLFIRVC